MSFIDVLENHFLKDQAERDAARRYYNLLMEIFRNNTNSDNLEECEWAKGGMWKIPSGVIEEIKDIGYDR